MSRIKIRHGREVFLDGRFIGDIRLWDRKWYAMSRGATLGVFVNRLDAIRVLVYPPAVDDEPVGNIKTWRRGDGRPLFQPGLQRAA